LIFYAKVAVFVLNVYCVILNTHYHAVKLFVDLARSQLSEHKMLSLWQYPGRKWRVVVEAALLLIGPIPAANNTIEMQVGLSKHDPRGIYRIDIFICFLMGMIRMKFLYRAIFISSDIFSKDGMVLSILTGTHSTAHLGFRAFTNENPVMLFTISLLSYLIFVGYLHNKLEGPTNYWPEDRWRKGPMDDDEYKLVKEGDYPVTLLNSFWLHFIVFSTIGFGECKNCSAQIDFP
jgi:hypothetical protein